MRNITAVSLSEASDRLVGLLAITAALLIGVLFCWMMQDLLLQGLANFHWSFLFDKPTDAGRSGGIGPLLVSTLWIMGICLLVTLPIGLATAICMTEILAKQSRLRSWLSRSLDILSSVPSIVFGLFGYSVFAGFFGFGFSILSGGLTLACMVLPLFVRLSEQSLLMVPTEQRQAAEALAISATGWIGKILIPAALPGIMAGLVVSVGRAMAETAALVFTSGYVMRMPDSVFDSGRTLSVHIYDLTMNVSGGNRNAATTALVLMALLLCINFSAASIVKRWQSERA